MSHKTTCFIISLVSKKNKLVLIGTNFHFLLMFRNRKYFRKTIKKFTKVKKVM